MGNHTYQYQGRVTGSMQGGYVNYSNIEIKDLNGDGRAEIIVAGTSQGYTVYANNGNYSFSVATSFNVNNPGGKNYVTVGDYDRDGKPDIAVIRNQGIQLYRNTTP